MASAGGARVSDAERQAVVELLRHHTGAGRLTLDEFADRAGKVYEAVTRDDLSAVLTDLPEGVRPESPPVGAAPAPSGEESERRMRRWFVAIMGGSEARGTWRAPEEINAFAFWGGVTIDLRNALIESPVVEINAVAIMGGIDIVVPPGIPVEMSGFVLMGSASNKTRSDKPIPGAPIIRVNAHGMWGGVDVRNPRRRRWRRDSDNERDQNDQQRHRPSRADRYERYDDEPAPEAPALGTASASDQLPDMPRTASRPEDLAVTTSSSSPASSPSPAETTTVTPPAVPPLPVPPPAPAPPAPVPPNGIGLGGATPIRVGSEIPPGTLTILISDITGSTQLAERLGDQVWVEVLQTHNTIVRGRVAEYGGTEVKAQGDGFLVVFPSARSAVLAAIAIQRAMSDYRDRHPDQGVELRVGLHTGEVVTSDGDIFGHNVVVASRIADAAGPGEILVSRLTRDLTASASDLGFDGGEDVDLKGVSEPWRVHRVVWQ